MSFLYPDLRTRRNVVLLFASVGAWMLLPGCGCGSRPQIGIDERSEGPPPALRIVAVTDLQGTLEPCGCTSRPLGGLDRLAAQLQELRTSSPTLFVSAGDLLFSQTPHGGELAATQERWKAETVLQAMEELNLAAATFGQADVVHGADDLDGLVANVGFPLMRASSAEAAGSGPFSATALLEIAELRVGVMAIGPTSSDLGVEADSDIASGASALDHAKEALASLQEQAVDLVIVLAYGDRRLSRRVAQLDGVDFVILGGLADREVSAPERVGAATVFEGGAEGQHLLVLDLHGRGTGRYTDTSAWTRQSERAHLVGQIEELRERIAGWEASGRANASDLNRQRARLSEMETSLDVQGQTPPATGKRFAARLIPLEQGLPKRASVTALMQAHDIRVNRHNARVFRDLKPPPAAPGEAHFVGSGACGSCHQEAVDWWSQHHHGRAYATLEVRNKEFNLGCVGCHVTGYQRPGGSTVTALRGGALKNVGCESCHGPASLHIDEPENANYIEGPVAERVCVSCHNPEHSDRFVYEAFRASLLVPGHGAGPE